MIPGLADFSGSRVGVLKEVLMALFSVRMSPIAFHLDYFVYPPVILACLSVGFAASGPLMALALLMCGVAAWTLAEYLLHRYTLHHWPYFSKFHQAHHDEPRAMIASPTLFTLTLFFTLFFLPAWALLGKAWALSWMAGFLSGYVAFVAVHHAVHHSENQSRLMRFFKRQHALHHHGSSGKNFGVTTDFWDRAFGTHERRPTKNH